MICQVAKSKEKRSSPTRPPVFLSFFPQLSSPDFRHTQLRKGRRTPAGRRVNFSAPPSWPRGRVKFTGVRSSRQHGRSSTIVLSLFGSFQNLWGPTHVLIDAADVVRKEKNVIKMETKICKQTFVKMFLKIK
jgi:hypothetical protein